MDFNGILPSAFSQVSSLTILGIIAFVAMLVVFTRNYRAFRDEPVVFDLQPDEHEIDRVEVRRWLWTSRMILTDRRVLFQRITWPFSTRRQRGLALEAVHDVRWRVGLNLVALAVAVLLLPYARPVSVLLLMLGLETMLCSVTFGVQAYRNPFSRPGLFGIGNADLARLARFFQHAQAAVARYVKGPPGTPALAEVSPSPLATATGLGFAFGRLTWALVVLAMLMALAQRVIGGHATFDDIAFAPILLALPLVAARRGPAVGLWAAGLCFAGAWSIKFPGFTWNDGGADGTQALLILATFLLAALVGGLLARHVHRTLAALGLLVWPAAVYLDTHVAVRDIRLGAIVLAAMALSVLLGVAADRLYSEGRDARS